MRSVQATVEMRGGENAKADFSRAIEETMDALYAVALRLTRNGADAEDLVAETVAKAWAAFSQLEDKERFRPWVFRILHNSFISDYRKKRVRLIEESDVRIGACEEDDDDIFSLLETMPHDFLVWWGNPEREYVNKLLGDDIRKAIASLPEAFRVTVILVNVEGLSYDEAAEVLGVPPGTVRSRMKRGRTLLQRSLWEQATGAGLDVADEMKEGIK
jgi:RNA polymerase sigma-70 factor (ECF subfamily)